MLFRYLRLSLVVVIVSLCIYFTTNCERIICVERLCEKITHLTIYKEYAQLSIKMFARSALNESEKALIYPIIQEMGIESEVPLYIMNEYALSVFCHTNAIACCGILFLNPHFFKSLSLLEQKFLIGHELVHIKNNHIPKRILISTLLPVFNIFVGFLLYKSLVGTIKNSAVRWLLGSTTAIGLFFAGILGKQAYLRCQEYEADRQSMAKLNVKEGGISFLEKCIRHYNTYDYGKLFNRLMATHPSYEDRIAQLEAIN